MTPSSQPLMTCVRGDKKYNGCVGQPGRHAPTLVHVVNQNDMHLHWCRRSWTRRGGGGGGARQTLTQQTPKSGNLIPPVSAQTAPDQSGHRADCPHCPECPGLDCQMDRTAVSSPRHRPALSSTLSHTHTAFPFRPPCLGRLHSTSSHPKQLSSALTCRWARSQFSSLGVARCVKVDLHSHVHEEPRRGKVHQEDDALFVCDVAPNLSAHLENRGRLSDHAGVQCPPCMMSVDFVPTKRQVSHGSIVYWNTDAVS